MASKTESWSKFTAVRVTSDLAKGPPFRIFDALGADDHHVAVVRYVSPRVDRFLLTHKALFHPAPHGPHHSYPIVPSVASPIAIAFIRCKADVFIIANDTPKFRTPRSTSGKQVQQVGHRFHPISYGLIARNGPRILRKSKHWTPCATIWIRFESSIMIHPLVRSDSGEKDSTGTCYSWLLAPKRSQDLMPTAISHVYGACADLHLSRARGRNQVTDTRYASSGGIPCKKLSHLGYESKTMGVCLGSRCPPADGTVRVDHALLSDRDSPQLGW